MSFITDDFLLTNRKSRHLYHTFAEHEPILDYHCHLPPRDISENRQFNNLTEAWLEGDHYKWRAMRTNGIDERYCTRRRGSLREVPGLGPHGSVYAPQSPVSLDSS